MIRQFKSIIKESAIYGFGEVSSRIVGFVLLPLYTEKISVYDYGAYGLMEAIIQFGTIIFSFGLKASLFRWLNIHKDNEKRGAIIFTTLIWMVITALFIVFAGTQVKDTFAEIILGDSKYSSLLQYLFLLIGLGVIRSLFFTLVRIYRKALLYSITSVSSVIFNLGFNIYLIVYLNMGIEGILISNIISSVFVIIILFFVFLKRMHIKIEKEIFSRMLVYGFPLIFSTLASSAIVYGDRFLIEMFLPLDYVGKYSFVYKIANIVNIFLINSFLLAWPAFAWNNISKPDPEKFMQKMLSYFVLIATWFTLGLSLFSKDLVFSLSNSPDYTDAYNVIPMISFSFVFYGIYHIVGFSLHYKKQTKFFAYFMFISAAANILLNFLLIPVYGLEGAAFATLTSYLVMAFLCYRYSVKLFPVKYELKKIFLIIFISVITIILNNIITHVVSDIMLFINIFLFLVFPVIIHKAKIFNLRDLSKIIT